MSRSLALGFAFSIIAATNGFAAPNCGALQGCTCVAPITAGAPVGQLTGVEGDVQKSGARGYTPVTASAPINVGDGLIIGQTGKALLTVGVTCQRSLGPQTSVFIRAIHGCACINTVDQTTTASVDHSTAPHAFGVTQGALFAASVIGTATTQILIMTSQPPPISP